MFCDSFGDNESGLLVIFNVEHGEEHYTIISAHFKPTLANHIDGALSYSFIPVSQAMSSNTATLRD